jgi:hypothetical protein
MESMRKFYMADNTGGGGKLGPDDIDIRNAEKLNQVFTEIEDTLRSAGTTLQQSLIAGIRTFDEVSKRTAKETIRGLAAELRKGVTSLDKTRKLASETKTTYESSSKIQQKINDTKSRQTSIENSLVQLERQGITVTEKRRELVNDIIADLDRQVKVEEQLLDKAKQREKAAGNIGKLFEGISKIPVLGQLIDSKDVLDKINKTAEQTGSRWAALGAGLSETFKSLGRSLTDPTTIITGLFAILKKIVDLIIQFNQKTFDLAKNLGTTVQEAEQLQSSFVDIANNSRNFGLRASEVAKTFTEITNSVGYLVSDTQEFAEIATLIQKRTGASAENMGALALQSALSGKTLEQTFTTLEASRKIEGTRNKLLLTQRQILDGISKTSSAVLINFKGNVEALGNAIVRATKLGTTLDTINKQGESLLDFESSISKEFEAQLLTGRDINLTKARELALYGKTAELMEELSNQQVTYDSFMKENVIARKAEAAAIGLSVEELSKQLLLQKQADVLGAKQGQSLQERYGELMKTVEGQKLIKEQLSEQEQIDLRRASIQDKFQSAVEKLQDTFGRMFSQELGQLLDRFADFVSDGKRMNAVVEKMRGVFNSIASILQKLPDYLNVAMVAAKAFLAVSAGRAVANFIAGMALGGPASAIGGVIAGGLLYNYLLGLGSGIQTSPPSIGGGESGVSMTPPLNPITATAQQNTQAADPANQVAPVFTFHHVTQLDGQVLTKYNAKETMKTQGLGNNKR